jgi:hypothetical protein
VIFDLLKYPKETDDKVYAVYQQTDASETDEGKLSVTYTVADAAFKGGEVARGSGELVEPGNGGVASAGHEGSEKVVEAEGECGGPCADEKDFGKSVSELGGSTPET